MSKFEAMLKNDAVQFGEWGIVTSREHHTREEAAKLIDAWIGRGGEGEDETDPADLQEAFIRHGWMPQEWNNDSFNNEPRWYGPVPNTKGAKPVWVLEEGV